MLWMILFGVGCWVLGTLLYNAVTYHQLSLCQHKHYHQIECPPEFSDTHHIYWVICTNCGVKLGEHQFSWME